MDVSGKNLRESGTAMPRIFFVHRRPSPAVNKETDKRAGNWTSCTCHGPSRERRSPGGPVTVRTCSTSCPPTLGHSASTRLGGGAADPLGDSQFGAGTQYH